MLLNQFGRVTDAFTELTAAATVADERNGEFWRAYVEMARLLQKEDKAIEAYQRLLRTNAQEHADLLNLIALLEHDRPMVAAKAAMFGFDQTGDAQFVQLALNASLRAGDHAGGLRFLRTPQVQQVQSLKRDHAFLATRSTLLQRAGELEEAERDLRSALALRPADGNYRAGLLWLLIARRDTPALKQVLSLWARDAEDDPAIWGAFAAANMSINRQRDALHWFRKSGFVREDYLWLMSYAEALEANSQPELAWRLRRHVWLELRRPQVLQEVDVDQLKAWRDRLGALAPLFASGDSAFALIQALLRADAKELTGTQPIAAPKNGRELAALIAVEDAAGKESDATPWQQQVTAHEAGARPKGDVHMSAAVRELALAYALSREAHDLARAWLATRFARQLATPLWADLSLALASDDRARLAQMLDDLPDWLPMYDRIEAAHRTGQIGLAQTLAFNQMTHLPHDEELHARFTALSSAQPPTLVASASQAQRGALQRTELRTELTTDITPRLKLTFSLGKVQQSSKNNNELQAVPEDERTAEAALQFAVPHGTLAAAIHHRQAARPTTGLRLSYTLTAIDGLELSAQLGIHQPAAENALLRVGAMRSGFGANASYALSRSEYLRAGFGWHRYETQAGTDLGSGLTWSMEAGTHLRIEYPNLTLRAFAAGGRFSQSGQFDAQIARLLPFSAANYRFLPEDDTVVGLGIGIGTVANGGYTRAWRPFGDIGISYGSQSGRNLNFSGGVAGSVLGSDTLNLRFTRSAGTPAAPDGFHELGLDYRWLY